MVKREERSCERIVSKDEKERTGGAVVVMRVCKRLTFPGLRRQEVSEDTRNVRHGELH